jgi:hypothetical protein
MSDKPDGSRTYRRDSRYAMRYAIASVAYAIPLIISFYCVYNAGDVPLLWISVGFFFAWMIVGFGWFPRRYYRCQTCGHKISKPTLEHFSTVGPLCYYCPICDIEWDTGVRMSRYD